MAEKFYTSVNAWRKCKRFVRTKARNLGIIPSNIVKIHSQSDQLGPEWMMVDLRHPDKRWVLIYRIYTNREFDEAETDAEQHEAIDLLAIPFMRYSHSGLVNISYRITWHLSGADNIE